MYSVRSVGGGCINDAQRVHTDSGVFFVKSNSAGRHPGMFDAEARGLTLLRSAGALAVPAVIGTGETEDTAWIVLEWIETGRRAKDFFMAFGSGLAALHAHTQPRFGLDHDNYIGSLPQPNRQDDDGVAFFIDRRLAPQLDTALHAGRIDTRAGSLFEKLFARLPDLLPRESPALLHGDLWSGNFMTGPDGRAVLIDPAVYYGLREADLAMTLLFGGFDAAFYAAYHAVHPLAPGWRDRMDAYNLYPLLVHVNLFGGGYAGQVMQILRRYV